MAVNEIEVAAPPETVWDVLSDPLAYAEWVQGTKRVRGADEGFPAPGTRLYHTVGAGPLTLSDSTIVVRSEPPRRLVLDARLGPLGSARVDITLHGRDGVTTVVLGERGNRGPGRLLWPAGDVVLRGRNRWSLERLKALVERRAA
ncbi:MAG TPA: SRPBCC domain-containing protein [Gaiellaceae bacterium]|jgi:uncharacterized protein YndB with AHSA1/START domain